jgi:peroxiredoxin
MPLTVEVGQTFPRVSLADDRGKEVTIEEIGNHQPLILSFFRGPW